MMNELLVDFTVEDPRRFLEKLYSRLGLVDEEVDGMEPDHRRLLEQLRANCCAQCASLEPVINAFNRGKHWRENPLTEPSSEMIMMTDNIEKTKPAKVSKREEESNEDDNNKNPDAARGRTEEEMMEEHKGQQEVQGRHKRSLSWP